MALPRAQFSRLFYSMSLLAKNPKASISAALKALNILKPWADTRNFKNLYRQNFCRYLQQVLQKKKKKPHFLPKLTYDGQILPNEKEVRFLGMLFDHRLTWAAHIKELTQRCQKDLNLMKLFSGTNFGADKIILVRLYTSLIRSKIHYGCQAYGSAAKSHLKKT